MDGGLTTNATNLGGSTFTGGGGEQNLGKKISKKKIKKVVEQVLNKNKFINEISYSSFNKQIKTNSTKQQKKKCYSILKSKLKEVSIILSHINKLKENVEDDFSMSPQVKNEILLKIKDIFSKLQTL